ncbi:MAG: carbohydrate ABC transporter permease, partial [Thermotogota bacterium]|nr:carbohydrate ABC transporter permease [Thermotogota bacterium]
MRSKRKTDLIVHSISYTLLIAFSIIMIMPFVWMILSTFKDQSELMRFPPKFLPDKFSLKNYVEVFSSVPFLRYYLNSILITTVAVTLTLLTSSLAGFA